MKELRPTLWRTCRVIANTTRLRLLWAVFEEKGFCVEELARAAGTSRENATIQLRMLSSRGLITPVRRGKRVIYQAEANPVVDGAEELLAALRQCCEDQTPAKEIFKQATAFTHSRRIALMQTVCSSPGDFDELLEASGMSYSAFLWNLSKLEARGFVKMRAGRYEAACPKDPLGKCLMGLVDRPEPEQWSVVRLISGGQTGADRAALDAAMACGIPHGGWCPKGRLAEDGPIPEKYDLQEMESASYSERTKANVEAADLTLIFSHGPLSGGSLLTQQFAEELGKPCVHMDLSAGADVFQALEKSVSVFPMFGKITLNAAGPRASNDPEIYTAVYQAMIRLLGRSQTGEAGEPDSA